MKEFDDPVIIGFPLASDLFVALKNAYAFNPEKNELRSVAGNYVIMKCSVSLHIFQTIS